MKSKKATKSSKKLFVSVAAVALIVAAGGIGYAVLHEPKPTANKGPNYVNLDPPSKADIDATNQHKKDLEAKANNQTPTTPSANTSASVTITYLTLDSSGVSAAGFVSNVFEDGGTCALTLVKDGDTATATSNGVSDVSKTVCPSLQIDRSKLSSGTWQATLVYNSSAHIGTSAQKAISIP